MSLRGSKKKKGSSYVNYQLYIYTFMSWAARQGQQIEVEKREQKKNKIQILALISFIDVLGWKKNLNSITRNGSE